ncbi:hypothetical protein C8R47DRAFT_1222752 [Mycena vitilis]|nr:hypothetical protein C8R47DRAFT_1222752 [Mycena vitilis]
MAGCRSSRPLQSLEAVALPARIGDGNQPGEGRLLHQCDGNGQNASFASRSHCSGCQGGETGICLIIVPTKVLVEQQAEVASGRVLRALAINEDTVRDAALDVRVAVMTPKMVQGKRMQQLLNSPAFVNLVRWVSVDEAGLADQPDGVFAAGYLSLPRTYL